MHERRSQHDPCSQLTNILYIDETPGFGGSVTTLARLAMHVDRHSFRSHAIARSDIAGDYLRRCGGFENVWVDGVAEFPYNGKLGATLSTVACPLGKIGRTTAQATLTALNWLGPSRHFAARTTANLSEVAVDAVYLNNMPVNTCGAGQILARRWKAPLFCKLQGYDWSRRGAMFARQMDLIFAASNSVAEPLLRRGIPREKIIRVFEPVDVEQFNPDRVRPTGEFRENCGGDYGITFGIVGMLVDWKGQDVFLRAAARVLARHPNAVPVVVGDDPEFSGARLQQLRELAAQLGIGDRVIFTGHRDDVPQVMAELDVVVHASTDPEPFGTVIGEAMSMKKPVVAANAGGPPEFIEHGQNGLLHEPGNAEELARAICGLLGDRPTCAKLGERGRQTVVDRFSCEVHARTIFSHIEKACKKHASTTGRHHS